MTDAPLSQRLNELRMGFMILTRLPVGEIRGAVPSIGASSWTWPVVGAAIGALAALAHALAVSAGVPPLLAACLAVLTSALATGGLHEDGLADLADGFGGGRTRERRLEIMRDSRIGSYGALALGFSLVIRICAIATIPHPSIPFALIALGAASRAPLPAALRLMPRARSDGLGSSAADVSEQSALLAGIIGLVALISLGLGNGLVTALAICLVVTSLGLLAKARIGGQTGDVLGAMQQTAELSGWICLTALLT